MGLLQENADIKFKNKPMKLKGKTLLLKELNTLMRELTKSSQDVFMYNPFFWYGFEWYKRTNGKKIGYKVYFDVLNYRRGIKKERLTCKITKIERIG